MTTPPDLVLVHGGLYEDMDGDRFWTAPGVTDALAARGFTPLVVDRPHHPTSWLQEADALARQVAKHGSSPLPFVAGSNGCSAAVRCAIDRPHLVSQLVICWPATAGDETVDAAQRATIGAVAGAAVADQLLAGDTLRGVSDEELSCLEVPCFVVPSEPPNPFHQRRTVDRLLELLPAATITTAFPEPPRSDFASECDAYADLIAGIVR